MHTACPSGKKVRIKLKDGTVIVTKFIQRDEQNSIITEAGKFRKRNIKSFSIYKHMEHRK